MNQIPPYFKRDLRMLLGLIVAMAAIVAGLWYLEISQGIFTNLAQKFLTW